MSDRKATASAARRSCYRVLAYLLFALVAIDWLVVRNEPLWQAYDPHPYRERLDECTEQPWDVVVVGGSPAMCGIDPDILSGVPWQGTKLQRVYNLGLPLGTTAEVYEAARHGLVQPPRLLVYGITATDLNEDRVEPSGPRQLMDLGDVVDWSRHRPEAAVWCLGHFVNERVSRLWKLFYYRNAIRLWAADQAEHFWPGLCPEAAAEARSALARTAAIRKGHGFLKVPGAGDDYALLKSSGATLPPFVFLENYAIQGYRRYLHRLLDWAQRKHVPLVLVDLPVPADLEEGRYAREFASFRALLGDVERTRGVLVLHATRALVGLTDHDFSDQVHLNGRGAARLSAWLRTRLSEPPVQTALAGTSRSDTTR